MVRKTSKILTYICGAVIVLLFAAGGFTQTSLFRQTLRSTLYKVLAANLNASVFLGDIKGNLFTGISLDTVAIYVDNAPFVEARNVHVRYDPFPLWNKKVSIGNVEIDHPTVSIIRFADGTWNVDRLSKKKSTPDSLSSPWVVAVRGLHITNARLRMIDSTASGRSSLPDSIAKRTIDFSNLDLQNINIDLSATISDEEQSATIKNISFVSPRDGFILTKLSGSLHHTPTFSEAKNLFIETPSSHIELNAKMSSADVFKIKDIGALRFTPVECSLASSTVAARDLQYFLPSLNFLRGSVQVECVLDGLFGDVKVKKLQAHFGHSKIILEGSVLNLYRPKDLTLDIESKGTVIQPSDAPALLPFFHIPDYGVAGPLALDFHYTGEPLNFNVDARMSMAAGEISVNGGLNLTKPVMSYRATFGGAGLDVGRFFLNPSLRSHLDFSGSVEGQGTSIEELNSRATVSFDSSMFHDVPISSLRADVTAANRKISISADARSPKGGAAIESELDYSAGDVPSYSLRGKLSHCDLEAVLKESKYSSDCSVSFDVKGNNFLHEEMNGDLEAQFSPSRFGTYAFDSAGTEIHLATDSLHGKMLTVSSPIADGSIEGRFTYRGIVKTILAHLGEAKRAYEKQRAIFDSTDTQGFGETPMQTDTVEHLSAVEKDSIRYSFHLKNLEPLSIFLDNGTFAAVGDVQGMFVGDVDTLSASGSVHITSAKYSSSTSLLLAESLAVDYSMEKLTKDSLLSDTYSPHITVKAHAGKVLAGESYYRDADVDFMFHNRRAEYSVAGEIDSTIRFGIDGRGTVTPSAYKLVFDTFSLRYLDYELNMAKQFSVSIDKNGIAVDTAEFVHQDEELAIGGAMNYGGTVGAFVRLKNFTLSNIYHFGKSQDYRANALAFEGTVNAHGVISGTVKYPEIVAELDASNLAYRGTEFGFVTSSMHYSNKVVDCTLQLAKTPQARDDYELFVSGSIPMDLALDSVSNRFSIQGVDMYLKSRDFDISILDPFIAQLDEMKGTMAGSIHCTGSLESPLFDGSMDLHGVQFLFPMNNMTYQAEGKIEVQGNKVLFTSLTAKNLYEDYTSGKIDFGGYLTLQGFVPVEYHLTAKGELKVLQEASRTTDEGVYGDLIAATGNEGLSFDGTYASSRLTGSLFVKQASLTFPPTKQASSLVSSRGVNVVVVDDTSKPNRDSLFGPNLFAFLRPKNEARSSNEGSFLDGLSYDLAIQTDGIVQIRMIFNPATNEELFADLNGKLRLSKEGNDVRLIGTINVSDKSNYKFYKQFDASGTLRFTGRPDNPELNIKATYTGSHVKSENPLLSSNQKETTSSSTEKVVVSLTITGTRYDPKVKIGLSTFDDNGNETERTGDVESDAISFLLTSTPDSPGKFRDDLTSNDKQGIANSLGGSIGGSFIAGFTNTLLSGMMMDFLRSNNINMVSTVEFRYSGTSPDLRLSGVIGNAFWSFGGKVFNDINNANVSLQWSLGSIVQNESLRNFMFEVDRKADPLETSDLRRPTSGARIYYKFAF
ncbi:MAG TPA: AsmA family protein [Bacteroidota bacterium]|nr:AsmA family protein [Bacteroidota bacterium]